MTPEERNILEVEVKLLDIHWTEILEILVRMPANERFLKKDQLEWLIKKGQPALRELVLENRVHQRQINEVLSLMDQCEKQMIEARDELDRLRLLARESRQFFETLNDGMELPAMYAHEFQQLRQTLTVAGYEPVAAGG